jgi:hypothetical protein
MWYLWAMMSVSFGRVKASARKLAVLLNAILRDKRPWRFFIEPGAGPCRSIDLTASESLCLAEVSRPQAARAGVPQAPPICTPT